MSRPTLRFKGFSDEWNNIKLGDLSKDVSYGLNAAAKKFDGVNKYLRITDIDESSSLFKPNPITSPDLSCIDDKYLLQENDICFTRTGASVGKCYKYHTQDGKLYYAGFLIKFSIAKNANASFIKLITERSKYWNWVQTVSMRSGQPGINAEEYKSFEFQAPRLREQEKIATFFSTIDQKIHLLKDKKEKLERYKKGVMQQIFSQQLRFKSESGDEFAEWEEKKLEEVARRITFKNKENNQNVLTVSAQQGLINQLKYFNKSVSAKSLINYYLIEKDDFAYNKSYSKGYPMGAIKRLKLYDKGVLSTLYICFKFDHDQIDLSFMEQYFEAGLHIKELENITQEGARNHGLLNIALKDFFKINLDLPCLAEQQKIADFLSTLDARVNLVETQIRKTELWKKGLLQQMFV